MAFSRRFGINADFEVPTPIRYGSKLAGVASHSYYLSFMNGGSNKSVDYIEFGFNATAIEYQGSGSLSRGYGLLFGWTPLPLPEMVFLITKKNYDMYSSATIFVAFTRIYKVSNIFSYSLSANIGPEYVKKISIPGNEDEYDPDMNYDDLLEAYSSMHDIDGNWGCRVNTKIKFFLIPLSDMTLWSVILGYTHHVFRNNHFNTFDIGLNFSFFF